MCLVVMSSCDDEDDKTNGSTATSDDATSGDTGDDDCDLITEACHPKDDGSNAAITSCHDVAHGGDVAMCTAQKAACIELCDAAPEMENAGDDDGHDKGSESGLESGTADTATEQTCEALSTLCHEGKVEEVQNCHDLGHAGDEAACAAQYEACVAACS